jgi:hypothetical protein
MEDEEFLKHSTVNLKGPPKRAYPIWILLVILLMPTIFVDAPEVLGKQ